MKYPAFVGDSYTARSTAVADMECINWYAETIESEGAQTRRSYFGTPGLKVFCELPQSPSRGGIELNGRVFEVGGTKLYELRSNKTYFEIGTVTSDGKPVSIAATNTQLLLISNEKAFCFTLATNSLDEITGSLVGIPQQCEATDTYFLVQFINSNKFQISSQLDGLTWPPLQVSEISVFAENLTSMIASHREVTMFGAQHSQVYQDTGTDEIFDPIGGAYIENGAISTFGRSRLDNTVFWVSEDERGARMAFRMNGYTPQRVSTHAVETAFGSYATMSDTVAYSYQDSGHLFWVLYIPSADCTWVYDVAEGLWAKRAYWNQGTGKFEPHHSWNHVYAFGKHLVGDWKSGKIYEMSMDFYDDDGDMIRRVRRTPILVNEMNWVYHAEMTADFDTGLGPQPPLTDGNGDPRPPQAILRWSNDRGKTWSNEHVAGCGYAGEYSTRVIWRRLGRSRYRLYELVVTDPIPWAMIDAYLRVA